MEFTYKAYDGLIKELLQNNYVITDYFEYKKYKKCVILRHDIDYDLRKSLQIAEIEAENGVKSTFFILLTTDFYNICSKRSIRVINKIKQCGHDIGLHFDEAKYGIDDSNRDGQKLSELIRREIGILSDIVKRDVRVVSMHRPSAGILRLEHEGKLDLGGIVNSYADEFSAGSNICQIPACAGKKMWRILFHQNSMIAFTFLRILSGIMLKIKARKRSYRIL